MSNLSDLEDDFESLRIPEEEIVEASHAKLQAAIQDLERLLTKPDQPHQAIQDEIQLYLYFLNATEQQRDYRYVMEQLDKQESVISLSKPIEPVEEQVVPVPPGPLDTFKHQLLSELSIQLFSKAFENQYGKVCCMTVNGYICVGFSTGFVLVYESQQLLMVLHESDVGSVTSMCLNGRKLGVGHSKGFICVWDLDKRSCRKIKLERVPVVQLHFIGDDLVSGDSLGSGFLHQLVSGFLSVQFKSTRIHGQPQPKVPTTLFAMDTGHLKATDHQLVCMCSPFKLAIATINPVPQIQYRLTFDEICKTRIQKACCKFLLQQGQLLFSCNNQVCLLDINSQAKRLKFKILYQQALESDVLYLDFITPQLIVCICLDKIYILNNRLKILQETQTDRLYLQDGPSHLKSLENVFVSLYKSRMFLLFQESIEIWSLPDWNQRLETLMHAGDFKQVFQICTQLYQNIVHPLAGLTRLEQPEIVETTVAYLDKMVNMTLGTDADPDVLSNCCKTVVETLCKIERLDLLFFEFYERFESFYYLEAVEHCVQIGLLDIILNPQMVQQMLVEYQSRGLNKRLEHILLSLDPRGMDINHIVQVCIQAKLHQALIYTFNKALSDYVTPLKILIEDQSDMYTVFVYLAYTLSGKAFPLGFLELQEALVAKSDIYCFLFSQDRMIDLLLEIDAQQMLGVLLLAFEDSILDLGVQTKQATINRQFIVDRLLKKPNPLIDCFVVKAFHGFRKHLQLSQDQLTGLTKRLVEDQEYFKEREQALLLLLETGTPIGIEQDKFREMKLWRVYERLVLLQERYDLAIESYLLDPKRQSQLFESLFEWLNSIDYEKQQLVKTTVERNLALIVSIDGTKTSDLYHRFWPQDHMRVLEKMEDQRLQLKYLTGLLQEDCPQDLYDLYLQLLCKFQPQDVKPWLLKQEQRQSIPYNVQKTIQLCQEHDILDALIWLMERTGDYEGALDRLLERTTPENAHQMLDLCLETLKPHVQDSEPLWIKLLHRLCFRPELGLTDRLIPILSDHISIYKILEHLIDMKQHERLEDNSQMIQGLYNTLRKQIETLEMGVQVQQDAWFVDLERKIRKQTRAYSPRYGQCQLCKRLLHVRAMNEDEKSEKLVVFSCRHCYHMQCLVEGIALVVDHPFNEKATLWCIVCGKDEQALKRAQKGKGAMSKSQKNVLKRFSCLRVLFWLLSIWRLWWIFKSEISKVLRWCFLQTLSDGFHHHQLFNVSTHITKGISCLMLRHDMSQLPWIAFEKRGCCLCCRLQLLFSTVNPSTRTTESVSDEIG
ncbi:Golgi CORVET complex core vacuolar protein 8-domain-containing protein [Gorgonomyces haynaldii]|nr:Golgi CORVET complex core vacuolar protein 8-domain-containing protein [Gorgonomyces haynaldii]